MCMKLDSQQEAFVCQDNKIIWKEPVIKVDIKKKKGGTLR